MLLGGLCAAVVVFLFLGMVILTRSSSAITTVQDACRLGLNLLDLVRLLATLQFKAARVRGQKWSIADMFEECAALRGASPAIIMVEPPSVMTYSQLDRRSNQVGHWALAQGLGKGDIVALVMPSCPNYVATWLGMAKAGVSTALVNVHIKGPPFLHAIRTALDQSKSKMIIVDHSLYHLISYPEVAGKLPSEVRIIISGGEVEAANSIEEDMQIQIASMCESPVNTTLRTGVRWDSPLLYVYTSGTTGLPKASKISHLRFYSAALMFAVTARLRSSDRVYCALPLYHSSGGMLGVGGCWEAGCALVIRSRFSVRYFAHDCMLHKCTVVQYIGEVARYLVNSARTEMDGRCCIRVAFGNGLSPDVWERFQSRYRIRRVVEFYASTEGNVNLVNNTGKVGAVGVVPWFAEKLYPLLLLKLAPGTDQLARDRQGRCIPCKPGESGQLVGLVNDFDPARRFDGYTDAAASARKIARHVVRPGDTYFASGDLLRKDAFGFFYFVDRIGDTFRWKGENVATTEVAQAMCGLTSVADVNVYGVAVPGTEGRAGMAAVKLTAGLRGDDFNWQEMWSHLDRCLPTYAQPCFIRVVHGPSLKAHMTTTFKHVKTQLRKDGFDPSRMLGDCLFLRDGVAKTYVPLTQQLHKAICDGDLRL